MALEQGPSGQVDAARAMDRQALTDRALAQQKADMDRALAAKALEDMKLMEQKAAEQKAAEQRVAEEQQKNGNKPDWLDQMVMTGAKDLLFVAALGGAANGFERMTGQNPQDNAGPSFLGTILGEGVTPASAIGPVSRTPLLANTRSLPGMTPPSPIS